MSPAPVIIAIDGRSGAGKTTLAIELAARLREHHKVSLFHLEDIYPGWNGLAAGIERYVATVLAPLSRGEAAEWISWDWERHYDGDARITLPAEIVIVEGVGAAAEAARPLPGRRHLGGCARRRAPRSGAGPRRRDLRALLGPVGRPGAGMAGRGRCPGPRGRARAQPRRRRGPGRSPAAPAVPARAGARARTRTVRPARASGSVSERLDVTPDAGRLFAALYGRSTNAVWLDSSLSPAGLGAEAAERSRFSILADDGGSFGQSVRHSSGVTCVSAGNSTVRTEGGRFSAGWTPCGAGRAVRAPEGYPCEFALGWLGYLGYELKRETGGSDVTSPTPDACLIFAGRAVVLDHVEGTAWLLCTRRPRTPNPGWMLPARPCCEAAGPAAPPAARRQETGTGPGRSGHGTRKPPTRQRSPTSQREIADGNTYEVCLTTALTASAALTPGGPDALDPWQTYLALRAKNPAPFASYLRFGGPDSRQHVPRTLPAKSRPTAGCAPNRSRAPAAGTPTPAGTRRCAGSWLLRQGPGGEHHDCGPPPQRPQPLRRAGLSHGQPAVRDRKLRHGAPDGQHHRRPAQARHAARRGRGGLLPRRVHDRRARRSAPWPSWTGSRARPRGRLFGRHRLLLAERGQRPRRRHQDPGDQPRRRDRRRAAGTGRAA